MTPSKTQIQNYLINRAVDELTRFLIRDYGYSIPEALDVVYNSRTYLQLKDTETGLYEQSPAYVYEYLTEEKLRTQCGNTTPSSQPSSQR